MKIIKASACDVSKLYKLEQELFSEENFPLSKASFYYHIRHNLLLIAQKDDGEIAGYALSLIRRHDAKLYSLGVSRAYRGDNIAYSLMQKMLDDLSGLGFKRTLLEVRTDNTHALALYAKLGFKTRKTIHGFYRDGCDAYLMENSYGH